MVHLALIGGAHRPARAIHHGRSIGAALRAQFGEFAVTGLENALQAADRIWLMTAAGVESGVPEDLVLQGHFHDAFQSKAYYFNSANGNFSMNYPMTKQVWIEGDKTRMYWTLRALARAGYMVVQDAAVTVEISTDSWFIDKKELKTVEELLVMLEKSV